MTLTLVGADEVEGDACLLCMLLQLNDPAELLARRPAHRDLLVHRLSVDRDT